MGTWSVVMSAVCDCTLLYVNMHHDQGYCVRASDGTKKVGGGQTLMRS